MLNADDELLMSVSWELALDEVLLIDDLENKVNIKMR